MNDRLPDSATLRRPTAEHRGRRRSPPLGARNLPGVGISLGVVLLLVAGLPSPATGAVSPTGVSPAAATGLLKIGAFVAHPYAGFWSVDLQGDRLANSTLAAQFNQTPFALIRYGGGVDQTNVTNHCTYTDSGVCGRLRLNYTQFAIFCGWVHCRSILGVPGEPDDPGLAAQTVRYVEKTVGFTPTFWSIGNEPSSWDHFGIPFPKWRLSDRSSPTALSYATAIVSISRAIRSVDPQAQIIGDQDAQTGSVTGYLKELALLSNAEINAVAFHSYPGTHGPPHPTIAGFLSALHVNRTAGFLALDQRAYDTACLCQKTVMVGEFNGALIGGSYDAYLRGYPDVPMTAATAAQLLGAAAPTFGFFTFWGGQPYDLVNLFTGVGNPTYELYADLLSHLPMGSTYASSISSPLSGIYAVEELSNTSGAGLLIVSTNTTTSLSVNLSGWFGSAKGTVLADSPPGGVQRTDYAAGSAPGSVSVPPEGVTLLLRGGSALLPHRAAPVGSGRPAVPGSGPIAFHPAAPGSGLAPGPAPAVPSGPTLGAVGAPIARPGADPSIAGPHASGLRARRSHPASTRGTSGTSRSF